MENEIENIDSTNDDILETEQEDTDSTSGEKREFTPYEKQLYARNKELQRRLKEVEGTTKPQESQDLSTKDLYALMQAQVPEDDIDEVVKASKLLGKTIPEALKDPVVSAILKRNDDYRRTAQASNAGKAKAGVKAPSPDEIMRQASEGKIPDKGSKEAEELFWAKRGGRR